MACPRCGYVKRSGAQNRLIWEYAQEVASQRKDMTAQDVHAFNKLHFGIAIRKEDEAFREDYNLMIRPLPYEQKLRMMSPPIDFPVTRDMSKPQLSMFVDAIREHWVREGVYLELPAERRASA